jgi:hypothetical protein
MPASVFFSYSHADKPIVRELAAFVAAAGIRVWIDEGELRLGDSIIEQVAEALDEVDFVAAFVSKHSVNSEWCRKEISLAVTGELARRGVRVLPLRIGDVAMPATLRDKVYLEVDPTDLSPAARRLVADVQHHKRMQENRSSGRSISPIVGEVSHRPPRNADELLAQYQSWVDSGDYRSCFGDWFIRWREARQPKELTRRTAFYLNALAALSGLLDPRGDINNSSIAMFAGTADQHIDYRDPEQVQIAERIRRLYFS